MARINGATQGYYRVHDQSQQRTVHSGVLFDLEGRRDAFARAFAGRCSTLPDADRLHDLARRTLAADALDRACRAYDRGNTATEPVDGFTAFALDLWPDARELPQWRALEARRAVGPARAHRQPRFVARAVSRRATEELHNWRWQRTGAR